MKNTIGTNVSVTLFGESHGIAIGAVIDGLAPGIEVDTDFLDFQLSLRRPYGKISTPRVEKDNYEILSGVFEGKTTGTPLCIIIPNENTKSKDYSETRCKARPGHADYTAFAKYHGFEDYRGGGHFSGRITAPIVAVGAIATKILRKKGIYIGTHISKIAGIEDIAFSDYKNDIDNLNKKVFAVLDEEKGSLMQDKITDALNEGDSVGGVLETAVIGLPAGVGEPWFDNVESMLSHGLFSIPAVKGVEFGAGFSIADMKGSSANDSFIVKDGKIETISNNNGGINGGITNGMPIIFKTAIKPTPTISREQDTADFINNQNTIISAKGRHDPCIVHRARVVVDSITAIILLDMLTGRFGTDWMAN